MKLTPFVLSALTIAGVAQQPQTATIEPSKDNTIYNFGTSLSNGVGTRFFCGTDLSRRNRRGLLCFVVRGYVPPLSTIQSVRLDLTVAQTTAPSLNVSLHRLTSAFGESSSLAGSGQGGGAPAQQGDATWNDAFFPNTPWQTPGGDFVPTASATTLVASSGTFSFSSAAMLTEVQNWLDQPLTAHGWIVMTDETSSPSARAFHSREATNTALRPKLVVTYLPPVAAVQSFGTGCNGGGAQPLTRTANSVPTIPNASFALQLSGGPAAGSQIVDLFLSLLPNPIPLPIGTNCSLWGDFQTMIVGLPLSGPLPLPVPNNPNLIGVRFAAQGLAFDPVTSAFATSNGLQVTVGV